MFLWAIPVVLQGVVLISMLQNCVICMLECKEDEQTEKQQEKDIYIHWHMVWFGEGDLSKENEQCIFIF